jgi:hypothetical protein
MGPRVDGGGLWPTVADRCAELPAAKLTRIDVLSALRFGLINGYFRRVHAYPRRERLPAAMPEASEPEASIAPTAASARRAEMLAIIPPALLGGHARRRRDPRPSDGDDDDGGRVVVIGDRPSIRDTRHQPSRSRRHHRIASFRDCGAVSTHGVKN